MFRRMTIGEFDERLRNDARTLAPVDGVALVCLDGDDDRARANAIAVPIDLPVAIVADRVDEHDATLASAVDCFVSAQELDDVRTVAETNPTALVTCAQVLRGSAARSVREGLLVESLAYSTLQSGREFATWLASNHGRWKPSTRDAVVRAERFDERLVITLDDPDRHNAYSSRMRDQLRSVLDVALVDPTVESIVVDGAGPSFSSGGDLSEFGSFSTPAEAHLVRTTDSVAAAMFRLADRLEVRVHGACVGAGVELAAIAARVVAAPSTTFRLPEVGCGLVPGAGGTVSLPRRIGRHRTAWLAFTGRPIDASTALAWGLVDEIESRP